IIFPETVEEWQHRNSGYSMTGLPKLTTFGPEGTPDGVVDFSEVTVLGQSAYHGRYWFSGCSAMTTLKLGEGVTMLAQNTFRACSALTTLYLPECFASVENETAFEGATSLKTIVGVPGSYAETLAKNLGVEFADVDSYVPEETTPEETTTATPETSATPDDTTKTEDTTGVDQATQTGDVNFSMIAAFAIAALGAAVVILRKRSFN
ncbi:MAG: hypothetical protein E7671_02685, partial [Ruminococcaceae bacterium]|nr:hypothetical protein [Oscillospiraceae bacterium]